MATAALSGVSLSAPRVVAKASDSPTLKFPCLNQPWKRSSTQFLAGRMMVRPVAAAPDLSGKIAESIKDAEEACAGDGPSGECAAAWDEVEELSAAVSHAKDKKKDSDPLEEYCKENPETKECRTYED